MQQVLFQAKFDETLGRTVIYDAFTGTVLFEASDALVGFLQAGASVEDFSEEIASWLRYAYDHQDYVPITYLSIEDIAYLGFDTSQLDDNDLDHIANKMWDGIAEDYWRSLEGVMEYRYPHVRRGERCEPCDGDGCDQCEKGIVFEDGP
jgi:hypothetical protein